MSLAQAVGDGDDRIQSLVTALIAAVRESEAGTEEFREIAVESLEHGLTDEGSDAAEAFTILAEGLGVESCYLVLDVAGPGRPPLGTEVVLAALEEARGRWAAKGYAGGDYTLVMFVESSEFFVPGSGPAEETCGIFGELVLLVSQGHVVEGRDRFSGCELDLEAEIWTEVPLTVEALFGFVEERAAVAEVEFDPDHGAPESVIIDDADSFLGLFVQSVAAGHPAGPDEVLAEVAAQRVIWKAAAVTDYSITLSRSCFCPPDITAPYTVTVAGGAVVSVQRDGAEIVLEAFMPSSVEDLFRVVEEAAFSDELNVQYHPELGYPVFIVADPVFNAVDEEFSIFVEEMVAVVP